MINTMRRKKILYIFCLIYILSVGFLLAEEGPSSVNITEFYQARHAVKINFFHWDRATNQKKEFIGTAELKDGKLTFGVSDKRLEKMLSGDFSTIIPSQENGKIIEKIMIYRVGSIEHLQNVVSHCQDISCIVEVAN